MTIRGRGRGQGSHTLSQLRPIQCHVGPSELDPILQSPGATSIDGNQSPPTTSVFDGGQSNVNSTNNDVPTQDPLSVYSHNEVDRRLVISVQKVSRPRRFVPDSVTRDIISEVLMRMPNPAEKWKTYSADMKEILFNDFKNKYRFASDYDRSMARKVWNLTCMDRYSNSLAKARKKARERANSDNIEDLKGFGPRGIRTEMWDALIDIWMTQDWKKKPIAGKNNRAAKLEAMVHTGGSISFGQHLKKMEAERNGSVSYGELYNKVHKKKDGQYVSNKAKNFIESYESAMVEKYGEDVSKHPKVDSEVWMKMGGENKKGRIHSIGRSLELAIINVNGSSSSVVGPSTNPNHASPTEEITTIATQMSQMQQQMQTQLDLQTESQKQLQIELQAQIEAHAQQVQAQLKAQTDMHAQFQAQIQAQIQAQMQAQVEMQKLLQQQMHTQMQTQMEFFKTQIFSALKIS